MHDLCAREQRASSKVTECNLVTHEPDIQATADRESCSCAHMEHTSKGFHLEKTSDLDECLMFSH